MRLLEHIHHLLSKGGIAQHVDIATMTGCRLVGFVEDLRETETEQRSKVSRSHARIHSRKYFIFEVYDKIVQLNRYQIGNDWANNSRTLQFTYVGAKYALFVSRW